jgi:hypothetical protein
MLGKKKEKEIRLPARMPREIREYRQKQAKRFDKILAEIAQHLHFVNKDGEAPEGGSPVERGMQPLYLHAATSPQLTVHGQFVYEDEVASRWTVHGLHDSEIFGVAATYKDIAIGGITYTKVVDGRQSEQWSYWDLPALIDQIGASPGLVDVAPREVKPGEDTD